MSESKVIHTEKWTLKITPGTSKWPPTMFWDGSNKTIRPDEIYVEYIAGTRTYNGTITGRHILKDGTEGQQTLALRFFGAQCPTWSQRVIEAELIKAGLIDAEGNYLR